MGASHEALQANTQNSVVRPTEEGTQASHCQSSFLPALLSVPLRLRGHPYGRNIRTGTGSNRSPTIATTVSKSTGDDIGDRNGSDGNT